jgi:hypothetical protein
MIAVIPHPDHANPLLFRQSIGGGRVPSFIPDLPLTTEDIPGAGSMSAEEAWRCTGCQAIVGPIDAIFCDEDRARTKMVHDWHCKTRALVLAVDGSLDLLGMTRALAVLCAVEDDVNAAAGTGTVLAKSLMEPADGFGDLLGYDLRWHCERVWSEGMVWILNGYETYSSEPLPQDSNPDTVRIIEAFHPRPDWTDQRLAAWSLGQVLVARGIAAEVIVT